MGIRLFVFGLLVGSIIFLFSSIISGAVKPKAEDKFPLITFINSIMYELDDKKVEQIVQSQRAYHFDTHEELYDATVVVRSNDGNETFTDNITANFIDVTKELLKFRGDVKYNRENLSTLNSEALDYDRIKQYLIGNHKFVAYHDGIEVKGASLKVHKDKTIFKGKDDTPVKIDITIEKDEESK